MRQRQPIGISCVNYCDVCKKIGIILVFQCIVSFYESYDTMSYHMNCILLYHKIVRIV